MQWLQWRLKRKIGSPNLQDRACIGQQQRATWRRSFAVCDRVLLFNATAYNRDLFYGDGRVVLSGWCHHARVKAAQCPA